MKRVVQVESHTSKLWFTVIATFPDLQSPDETRQSIPPGEMGTKMCWKPVAVIPQARVLKGFFGFKLVAFVVDLVMHPGSLPSDDPIQGPIR